MIPLEDSGRKGSGRIWNEVCRCKIIVDATHFRVSFAWLRLEIHSAYSNCLHKVNILLLINWTCLYWEISTLINHRHLCNSKQGIRYAKSMQTQAFSKAARNCANRDCASLKNKFLMLGTPWSFVTLYNHVKVILDEFISEERFGVKEKFLQKFYQINIRKRFQAKWTFLQNFCKVCVKLVQILQILPPSLKYLYSL